MRNSVSSSSLAEEEGEVLFCIPDVQIFHISAAVRNQIVLSGQFFLPFQTALTLRGTGKFKSLPARGSE